MARRRYERRRRARPLAAAALLMAVAGCAKAAPDCSDAVTLELLRQSVERQLRAEPGGRALAGLSIEFSAVRTLRRNFQTGAWQCAAEVQLEGRWGPASGIDALGLALGALGGGRRLRVLVEQGPHELRYTTQFTDDGAHHVWSELQ